MLPLLVWLAGLATAAAAAQEREQRHRQLMEALSQRLGVKLEIESGLPPFQVPSAGGVPIWVWADGDRIVRIVTPNQLKRAADEVRKWLFSESEIEQGVSYAPDVPTEPQLPGWSVFAYLDEHNRLRAYLEATVDGEIFELAGTGDAGSILTEKVRSRMFQFISDLELTGLNEVTGRTLWYQDVLVYPGFEEIVQATVEGADEPWLAELLKRTNRWVHGYAEAYIELYWAWREWTDNVEAIQWLWDVDPESTDFYNYLVESDWQWRLEDQGFDLKEIEAAYGPDGAGLMLELRDRGFDPARIRRAQIEILDDDFQMYAQPLWDAVDREAEEAVQMLSADENSLHRLVERRQREGRVWELKTEGGSAWNDEWEDLLATLRFDVDSHRVPTWSSSDTSVTEPPGLLSLMAAMGRLETKAELYAKAPEETVWVWPGDELPPELEAGFLLDETSFDPVRTELVDFLRQAHRLGLLHPDTVDYWKAALD